MQAAKARAKAPRLLARLKQFCGLRARIASISLFAGIVVVTLIFHEPAQNTV
jgi:hypothetical protein